MELNNRSRLFRVLLYPDNEKHLQIFNSCKFLDADIITFVNHNNDYDDESNLKKEHYHGVIYFKNPRSFISVLNKLDISPDSDDVRFVRCPNNRKETLNHCLRYLFHLDNPEKTQYNLDNIIFNSNSSLVYTFSSWLDSIPISLEVIFLNYFEWLEQQGIVSKSKQMCFFIDNGYLNYILRFRADFEIARIEHNERFGKK